MIVLHNLQGHITNDITDEALSFFDFFDKERDLHKWIDSLEIWDELLECRDKKDLEELIPLLVCDDVLAFDVDVSN